MTIKIRMDGEAPSSVVVALKRRRKWLLARGRPFRLVVPPMRDPRGVERRYIANAREWTTIICESIERRLFPRIPDLLDAADRALGRGRRDAFDDDLASIMNGILIEYGQNLTDDQLKSTIRQRAHETAEWNATEHDRVIKSVLGFDLYRHEPWLEPLVSSFVTENVSLIKSIPARLHLEVEQLVLQTAKTGGHAQGIRDEIRQRLRVSRSRAELIARDQIGKLNGQLTMQRQTDIGVTRYRWRTSLDERVRKSHRALEGRVFSWDANAPANQRPPEGHPGQPIQCRCYAEPLLEDLIGDENP